MESLIDAPTLYMLLFLGVFGSAVVSFALLVLTLLAPREVTMRENVRIPEEE